MTSPNLQDVTLQVKREISLSARFLVSEAFGKRVFKARQAMSSPGHAVSQTAVGRAIGVTGVTVGSWEAGKTEPDFETVVRLAKVLNTTPEWLAFGREALEPVEVPSPPRREQPEYIPGVDIPRPGEGGGGRKKA